MPDLHDVSDIRDGGFALECACISIALVIAFVIFVLSFSPARQAIQVTSGYEVTVYTNGGGIIRHWVGLDKVNVDAGGTTRFFDNDGNRVVISPGCRCVVEWNKGSE